MSRPPKSRDAQRTRQVIFRLTEAEYAELKVLSKRSGLRVNELARRLARRGSRRVVIQVSNQADPAYIAQIRALGVNLNQLTRRSNITGEISPHVEALCAEIRDVVLTAAVGQS